MFEIGDLYIFSVPHKHHTLTLKLASDSSPSKREVCTIWSIDYRQLQTHVKSLQDSSDIILLVNIIQSNAYNYLLNLFAW